MMRVCGLWLFLILLGMGVSACGSRQAIKPPQPDAKPVQKAQPLEEASEQIVTTQPVSTEKSEPDADTAIEYCTPSFSEKSITWSGGGSSERVAQLSDLDGDQKAEVITYHKLDNGGSIKVYKQNAEGTYVQLAKIDSIQDTQGANHPLFGNEFVIFTGFFSKKSKDNKVKDLLIAIRDASMQQFHILRWDLTASGYGTTAAYSAVKGSDVNKNIHADLFPVSAASGNVFRPVLVGNFLGGNYDGIVFYAVNMADVNCLSGKTTKECGDATANMFLVQFDREGVASKLTATFVNQDGERQPLLTADGVKRQYRWLAGRLVVTDTRKGIDLLAQRRCRTDVEIKGDDSCEEPGSTALGGPGGARAYINTSQATNNSMVFDLSPAVGEGFDAYNVHGSQNITTYDEKTHEAKKISFLELGDADRDGFDDLFVIYLGDPSSQETGKKSSLCIRYNLTDGFSENCDLTKTPIVVQASAFVSDLNGDGTSDVLFQDPQGTLSALHLACQEGIEDDQGGSSGTSTEDLKF